MIKELIINDLGFETRVALLEDGTLVELYVERGGERDIVGNIYKGRVLRVLPGMQAAFVDIGMKQAAFIYVDDVVNGFPGHGVEVFSDVGQDGDDDDDSDMEDESSRHKFSIDEVLQEGQEIIIQVAKSPIGNKGARVTSRVTLPGRYLVFMPTTNHIGVSRRIEDPEERSRLKEGLGQISTKSYGYIARTVSEGADLSKLSQEVDFLNRLWERIEQRYWQAAGGSVIHKELSTALRAVRDLFTKEVDRLVIDSIEGYKEILEFVETFMPSLKDAVEFWDCRESVFEAYHIEGEISRLTRKKVWLKSGGYIVIENTEALVSIDVNTGRYVGKESLAETILKTNLEALKEIAYQLRLRDIGGIIVIDFIDMESEEDRVKVHEALVEALKKDRSTTNVLPMSEMGLIEMTRKRTRENLGKILSEPCSYCDGEGVILSKKSISHKIYREILATTKEPGGDRIVVRTHPEVAKYLLEEENLNVLALEKRVERSILIHADDCLNMEAYELVEMLPIAKR